MTFEIHKISSPLDKYIESIFYYKDYVSEHTIERVVPTGNIFLLVELDGFERSTFNNDLQPIGHFKNTWVSGMQKKYLNISVHQHSEMLVIQFKPTGAYPFFKIPIFQLNDTVIQSETYFGETVTTLRNKVAKMNDIKEKFMVAEQWLLQILDEKKTPPQDIVEVVGKLQSNPFSKHNELLTDYSKTNKNLINQFKKYCGLTPKALHRIFRFNTLLANINQKEDIVWTDIVYETGYADQAHFIKEFQEFCGFNPSKFIKNGYNNSVPNFLPIDK
ncbi:MAG: helix-turn-helix domain-containing protein [Bacteroidota bacterium]|nr:helix-turn-helix domain-containing protein [Bacteroidota bacterium]